MIFKDRRDAGRKLAQALLAHTVSKDAVVIALPRGGVVVAYEIAQKLSLPLDVLIVRKIGAPGNPEFGLGAIAEDESLILNMDIIQELGLSQKQVQEVQKKEIQELVRRLRMYRRHPLIKVEGKIVILVDDGVATGVTVTAAIAALKKKKAGKIILAVPVAEASTISRLQKQADKVICLFMPDEMRAIGNFYKSFKQVTDSEVIQLLDKRRKELLPS